jgi:hypothetical protein
MERTVRVGIATLVVHDREYFVVIEWRTSPKETVPRLSLPSERSSSAMAEQTKR